MASRAALEGEERLRAPATGAGAEPLAKSAVSDLLLQRMAGAVLGSGVGVVRGHCERGPRWANAAFLRMAGREATDLPGLSWSAIMPDGVLPPAASLGEIAPSLEQVFFRADGTAWPVIVSRASDPTDPSQAILFVVDLTASHLAEAARRTVESRYARFFEVSNVAFWTADAQGRARLTSETTAERLGTEVQLDSIAAQAELIHPDDRTLAAATWQGATDTGKSYDIEVRARGLDGGDYRWTRLRAFPDHEDGAIVGWYGTTEDIHERRLASDALAESEQRFKRLADEIPSMIWLTDETRRATYLSRAWYDYTGQTEDQAIGFGWLDVVLPEDLPAMTAVRTAMAKGESFDVDLRVRGIDGNFRWMLSSGRPRLDPSGALVGYAGTLTDIHPRKTAESALADAQVRLSRALDGTGVGVWEWDAATDTVSVSGSALGITGFASPNDSYREVDYRAAIHHSDRARMLDAMADYVAGRCDEFAVEVRVRRRDGGWVWVLDRGTATLRDAGGRALRMVGTLTDIDESKRAEERLRWTVEHDALTGLASRTLFHDRLDAALAAGGPVALALLDIDDFKRVNDELGHAAGDALLNVLAGRLADFALPHETVARLGGDEFTLIMPGCADSARLAARLEQLRAQLAEPFVHDGRTLSCRSSIGAAIAGGNGDDASALLRNADIAMYSAKAGGTGAVAFYTPALGARARIDTAIIAAVRATLDAGNIAVCYEPVIRLADGTLGGFEAHLKLWGEDVIDAHDLDTLSGDPALSARLGDAVLEAVLTDFARWRSHGREPGFIVINVSLSELQRHDYAAHLLARLAAHGVEPGRLRLDLVETGLLGARADPATATTLAVLRRAGVPAGLDRFGCGMSSLADLSRLSLAAVRIDPQFTRGVESPGPNRTIVRAVVGIGRSFGMRVVGSGIATAAEAAALATLGCTYGQGTYFGSPGDADAALARLGA